MTKDHSYQPSKAELEEPVQIDAQPDELARTAVTPKSPGKRSEPLKAIAGAPDRPLVIGDIEIQCYVLEDETRVLSQRGLQIGIGMGTGGSTGTRGAPRIARFVMSLGAKGIPLNDLAVRSTSPIKFRPTGGGKTAYGYPATFLVDLCNAILAARDAKVLQKQQDHIARQAEILMRGLATVGIIGLVDEATGYQDFRSKRALATILEKFIAKELQPWTKTFPYEFYEQICRLKDWPSVNAIKRPAVIGKYTNDFVYERLAPGVLDELRQKNPVLPRGTRKHKHHQWFTPEHGHPKLREHLSAVVALMRAAATWSDFKHFLNRAFTKQDTTIPLPLGDQPMTPSTQDRHPPSRPVVRVKPHDYQPSKAEINEPVKLPPGTTARDLALAVVTPVTVVED